MVHYFRRISQAVVVGLACAMLLAACGGSDADGGENDDAATAVAATGATETPATPAGSVASTVSTAADSTVGPGGGMVAALDGAVTLEVPAGALDQDVEIRIAEVAASELPAEITDLVDVTRVLRFEPDGLQFAQPVRVSLRLPIGTAAEDGGESPLPVLITRSNGTYAFPENQVAALDMDEGVLTLSADLEHFSEVWDNLPRDGGIRVRYSGIPAEWRVGEDNKFTATSTVSQSAESSLSFIEVRWESWNNSPIRPWIICEDGCDMGVLDANREQTLSRDDEYWCSEAGQGRWTASVEFGDDLAQAVFSFLGGAKSSIGWDGGSATYTSEAFRSIRCTGGAAVQGTQGPGGVAAPTARLTSIRSEFRAPVTTYTVAVAGGGNLTFEWTMTGEACGTPRVPWTQTGPVAQWSHSDQPPDNCTHLTANHSVVATVTVRQDGQVAFTCTIRGSDSQFPDWNTACDPPQGQR